MNLPRPSRPAGFTRSDLLSVLASVALLGLLALNVAGTTRARSSATRCLANFRSQATAWTSFAMDNVSLPKVLGLGEVYNATAVFADAWASGWLTWSTEFENTNHALLRSPGFAPYLPGGLKQVRDFSVFRCPDDRYWSQAQVRRGWVATGPGRVRSYALNAAVGSVNAASNGLLDTSYKQVTRLAEISNPARIFFLTEEHPDSINDPALYPPRPGLWIDIPASFHDGGAHFAFADGHVEPHRWRAVQTVMPVRFKFAQPPPNLKDPDVLWVSEHTPRR